MDLLICGDIFDFSSGTAERNSTKLDRKQDLNVPYQVCVFRGDRKTKKAIQPLVGWDIFDFFFLKPPNRIQWNLTGSKILTFPNKFVFFSSRSKNQDGHPAFDWLRHFRFIIATMRSLIQ